MKQSNKPGWLKHLDFILLDVLSAAAAFFLSYYLYYDRVSRYWQTLYRQEILILILCLLVSVLFGEPFHGILRRGYYREFAETFKHTTGVLLLNLLCLFAAHQMEDLSRVMFSLMGIFYLVFSYLSRCIWKKFLFSRKREHTGNSLVVLTGGDMLDPVLADIRSWNAVDFRLTAVLLLDEREAEEARGKVSGLPVIGGEEAVTEYICHEWVDEVLVRLPEGQRVPERLMHNMVQMGLTVHQFLMQQKSYGQANQGIERLGNYTVVTSGFREIPFRELVYKRLMDIAGGLAGSLAACVLFLVLGPLICLSSPGPVIFSQVRVGKNGKKFRMYKFRSMYPDAEERKKEYLKQNKMQGLMFKLDDDPRIIGNGKRDRKGRPAGIGHFIRRTSLDEFPQFFNVLKGDMSLVGTRPPTVDEWERYDLSHRIRMSIKPGITGLWQISGRSNITDFNEVVRLDTEYIQNWNLAMDLKILLKTVRIVLKGSGAE